jgi:hypothetical protein
MYDSSDFSTYREKKQKTEKHISHFASMVVSIERSIVVFIEVNLRGARVRRVKVQR